LKRLIATLTATNTFTYHYDYRGWTIALTTNSGLVAMSISALTEMWFRFHPERIGTNSRDDGNEIGGTSRNIF